MQESPLGSQFDLLTPLVSEDPCLIPIKLIYKHLKLVETDLSPSNIKLFSETINEKNIPWLTFFIEGEYALNLDKIYTYSFNWMEEEDWPTEDRCRWIEKLFSLGVKVDAWYSFFTGSGINWAIVNQKFDLATFFWNKGARFHLLTTIDSVNGLDRRLDYILSKSVPHILQGELMGGGHTEIIEVLKMAKEIAQVALFQIVLIKHKDIVQVLKKLLTLGADPNLIRVLHYAAKFNTP